MREKREFAIFALAVLAVGILAVSVTPCFLSAYYSRLHMQALGGICQKIVEREPGAQTAVLSALKEYKDSPGDVSEGNFLETYGYLQTDFFEIGKKSARRFAVGGCLVGGALFFLCFFLREQINSARIRRLTEELENINSGRDGGLFAVGEDDFSRLSDEIYKTLTELYQTRDAAFLAKKNFADNLYNIAHQIKTPITAISLSVQMIGEGQEERHLGQIQKQLSRLSHLEEALLLLSRIDAGTLPLERKNADVFTLLMLAADNLQALFRDAEVSMDICEMEEMGICVDLEWTMEAVMNLMKNCMEHTPPGGKVHCGCKQNLLYTQIRIWDEGAGFAKEDIPHLFERFYRGKKEKSGGIGIGLALARAIIESQNGTVAARNLPEGGACFEIHFYSH